MLGHTARGKGFPAYYNSVVKRRRLIRGDERGVYTDAGVDIKGGVIGGTHTEVAYIYLCAPNLLGGL